MHPDGGNVTLEVATIIWHLFTVQISTMATKRKAADCPVAC
jgi:hypothetical protein